MKAKCTYFEDYEIGETGVTNSRTVSDADLLSFASITGDYSQVHMDRHATMGNAYGGRVAHGMLGASLMVGLLSLRAPHTVGRGVPDAYLWHCEFNYKDGLKPGETIKVQWKIKDKKEDEKHPGFGIVTTYGDLLTQDGKAVYNGTVSTLVRKASAKDTKLRLEPDKPWDMPTVPIDPEKAYWSEDMVLGIGGETDGRTITETDIVNFACLTADYSPIHMDADFARNTQFGERIAQGMLIFGIANGFRGNFASRYVMPESKIAGHLGDTVTFFAPVKIGDTIRYRYKITGSRPSKSIPGTCIIPYGIQAINQRNEVVQELSVIFLIPSRKAAGKK